MKVHRLLIGYTAILIGAFVLGHFLAGIVALPLVMLLSFVFGFAGSMLTLHWAQPE